MSLTVIEQEYKNEVESFAALGELTRKVRYGDTELAINPFFQHKGMTRQPGVGDVEYYETWKLFVGKFVLKEQGIPKTAFNAGEEWEYSEDDGASWEKLVVLQPSKNTPRWYEVILTPALL